MTERQGNALTAAVVGGGLVVYACFFLAFERPALFEVMNAAVVAVGVGVVVGFTVGAWRVLWGTVASQTAGGILVLGVWVLWIGLVGAFLMLWMYRLTGNRFWLDSPPTALTRWLIFTGGVLHLAAAGAIDGRIPARSYIRAGIIAGFGVAIALFLVGLGVE